MPSDETAAGIFAALTPAIEAFRSALTDAAEALRAQIEGQRASAHDGDDRVALELGAFAAGRIDAARFSELLDRRPTLDERSLALLESSRVALTALAAAGAAPFRLRVPAGGNLVAEAASALAVAGRAFAAARIAELVRSGRTQQAQQEDLSGGLPFARWTRGELRIAPPLLIEVDGGDFQPAGLAQFLDGAQKLAFVVAAPAPPAALARLITPGVFVMQTTEAADFVKLDAFDGPAIGALVPEGCATFLHDPAGVPRLTAHALPDVAPATRIGRISAFQQGEELALLRMLADAAKPARGRGDARAPAPARAPADRLAAWLLQQADLTGIA